MFTTGYGIQYFKNCIIGDATCTIPFSNTWLGVTILQDCTINQSDVARVNRIAYNSCFIYNSINFTNATPARINGPNTANVTYSSLNEIYCKNLTVDEQNNLQDCEFNVYHENFRDFEDPANVLEDLAWNWDVYSTVLKLFNKMNLTDASGQSTIMVPWKMCYHNKVTASFAWYELSESGGAYSHNGQYKLVLSKDGYRRAETTLYGSSDQTWSPTLQPQTDFDDILTCCNDVKGTGFIMDTDSLVNLSHIAGAKGTDNIHDDLVTVDTVADSILTDTGTTLPAEHVGLALGQGALSNEIAVVDGVADNILVDTNAIDTRLPPDPADQSDVDASIAASEGGCYCGCSDQ